MSPVRFWEAAYLHILYSDTRVPGVSLEFCVPMLETLITIVHIIVVLFLILVVLVQGGNQGGISAAFGGGNSGGFFGASGATSFLGKLTYGAATLFMITSLSLSMIQGKSGDRGLKDKLKESNAATAPAAPAAGDAAPAAPAPAPSPAQ